MGLKRSVTVAEKNGNVVAVDAGDGKIKFVIAVKVSQHQRPAESARLVLHGGFESSVPIAHEDRDLFRTG